jgi:hypothetical protein
MIKDIATKVSNLITKVLLFNGSVKLKGILGNRRFRNGNTGTKIVSAVSKQCQHDGIQPKKHKIPISKFLTNINHHSYNKQLVWNCFAFHTAGR